MGLTEMQKRFIEAREQQQAEVAAGKAAAPAPAATSKLSAAEVADRASKYGLSEGAPSSEVTKSILARNALVRAGVTPGAFSSATTVFASDARGRRETYRGFPRAEIAAAVGLPATASSVELDAACRAANFVEERRNRRAPVSASAGAVSASAAGVTRHEDGGVTYKGVPVRFDAAGQARVFTWDGWVTTAGFDAAGADTVAASSAMNAARGQLQSGPLGQMYTEGPR